MRRDYYDVLGVSRDASETHIKKSFRRLARELHPDVNRHDPEAEEKFKEAAEAYEVLSDPNRRSTYDRYGHEGLRSGGFEPSFAGFSSFGDIFSAFFGSESPFGGFGGFGERPGGPAQGGDAAVAVAVTLEEAAFGAKKDVEYDVVAPCDACRGNGAKPGTPITACGTCRGTGQVRTVSRIAFGEFVQVGECGRCGGAGKVAATPCEQCAGKGRRVARRRLTVEIPSGIDHEQRIRLAGHGHAGDRGGPAGHLYALVRVRDDDRFERHGSDLVTTVDVPAPLASLGTAVRVPTLEGDELVEVPPGTQPNSTIVLRGRGVPRLRRGGRGDLHIAVNVVVPHDLDDEQQQLARRFADSLRDENIRRDRGVWGRIKQAFR